MQIIKYVKKRSALGNGSPVFRQWNKEKVGSWLRYSTFVKVLIGVVTVLIMLLLFSGREITEFSHLKVGMVSDMEVIAPFTFSVPKSPKELHDEREHTASTVIPVVVHNKTVALENQKKLDSLFTDLKRSYENQESSYTIKEYWGADISERTVRFLTRLAKQNSKGNDGSLDLTKIEDVSGALLNAFYKKGVIEDKKLLIHPDKVVSLIDSVRETKVPLADIYDLEQTKKVLSDSIRTFLTKDNAVYAVYEIVLSFLVPDLTFDGKITEERRNRAINSVRTIKKTVLENSRILDEHEIVTPEHVEVLRALGAVKAETPFKGRVWLRYLLFLARFLVSVMLIFIFYVYLRAYRPKVYNDNLPLILFSIILLIPVSVTSYVAANPDFSEFIVPVALSAMLATVLFDAEVGLAITAVVSFAVSSLLGYDFRLALISMVCGTVAVYTVRHVRHRNQFYRSMLILPLAYMITVTSIDLLRLTSVKGLLQDLLPSVLNGFLCPILTIGFLPIFESAFKITTDITLLELSDLNRPLLKNLAIEAPGTYNHTMVMSMLAEAAARTIGTNSLLARVGCYYHDIGKIEKPEYFVENQKGKNPHDRLSPSMSALILISHVKGGLEIADRYKLPQTVQDFIPQHHGTSIMSFFYNKALQMAEDEEEVSEETFRYPGPRPQTKEAAIVMLADVVEAAVRALPEKTYGRIKGTVKSVIDARIADSQLDESDLTLKELNLIADCFVKTLVGMFHLRLKYPDQETQEREEKRSVGVSD